MNQGCLKGGEFCRRGRRLLNNKRFKHFGSTQSLVMKLSVHKFYACFDATLETGKYGEPRVSKSNFTNSSSKRGCLKSETIDFVLPQLAATIGCWGHSRIPYQISIQANAATYSTNDPPMVPHGKWDPRIPLFVRLCGGWTVGVRAPKQKPTWRV